MLHGRLCQLICTPKLLKPSSEVSELRAPITQVVDAFHVVAQRLEAASEAVPEHGRAQVSGVERLGDVWRTELDEHGLSLIDLLQRGTFGICCCV